MSQVRAALISAHVVHSLTAAVLLLSSAVAAAGEPKAGPWLKPDPAAVKRWQDMRFGMFIHWGPVSLTHHEIGWSRGRKRRSRSTTTSTRSSTR